jgi:DNA-binding CsgD family transcriptional regulator/tetratricopeptide (TPR) repeat protein
LLEREEVLEQLGDALAEAHLGRGGVLLVGGEAGVGKTTLVRAFLETADNARVRTGACDPLSTPRPLGPLMDIAEPETALCDLVQLGAPPADVFAALHQELEATHTVLVLEDLHWADGASLDVLRLLARRIEALRTLVIATFRDDGLDRAHPMRTLLGDLGTVPGVRRIGLDPLSRAAVEALAIGHAVDVDELYERTGGNPYFVTAVLSSGDAGIPATVRDSVLARTARLDPAAMRVLETVAVTPPCAEHWLLGEVVEGASEHLESCHATGLVTDSDGGISFRHELARQAVEEATPVTRRLALQRAILAALVGRAPWEQDPARLAHHAEAAQDADAVLAYAPEAARRAASAGAYREASAQYARALRFSARLTPGERAALLEGRSRACYLADDQVEAIEVISEAITYRKAEGAAAEQARALAELSSYLLCRGRYSEARAAVEEAAELVSAAPASAEAASVLNAQALLSWDDRPRQLELARAAVEIAQRCGAETDEAEARITLGEAEMLLDYGAGCAALERVVAECRAAGRTEQVARALSGLGQLSSWVERPDEAASYLRAALEHCEEHNLDLWRIHVLAVSAIVALEQGRWTDAADFSTRLLADPRESPWPNVAALLVLALVRARRGDPDAHAPLEEALRLDVPPEEVDVMVDRAAAQAEIAWLERRLADVDAATAATLAAALERDDTPAICKLSYWRRLAGLEVDLPADAEGPLALGVAGAWEEAAAEWRRRGRPYEAALALAETGDEELLREAHDQLQQLGALPALRLVRHRLRERGVRGLARGPRTETRENRAGLTPRELEVLSLVVDGLRNAEIAERLVVSPKTVDHHVSAILRKLGVDARGKAAAEAARRGLLQDR